MSKLRMGVRLSELPSMDKFDLSKDDIILLTDSICNSNVSKKFTIDEFLKSDIVKNAIKSSIDLTKYVTIEDQDQFILGNKRFIKLIAEDAEIAIALINRLSTGLDCIAPGEYSRSGGIISKSYGNYSVAEGDDCISMANNSMVIGTSAMSLKDHTYSYVWSGVKSVDSYKSHGLGTFNINPVNGLDGIYIGEDTLKNLITELIPDVDNNTLVNNNNTFSVNTDIIATKDYVNTELDKVRLTGDDTSIKVEDQVIKVNTNTIATKNYVVTEITNNKLKADDDSVVISNNRIKVNTNNIASKLYVDNLVNGSKVDVSDNTLINNNNSLSVNTNIISTKAYVDEAIDRVTIDESNLVHKTDDEIIEGNKTFNDNIILDQVITRDLSYTEPSDMNSWTEVNVTSSDLSVTLSSGNYKVSSNLVGKIVIPSNANVQLYIADGVTLSSPTDSTKYGSNIITNIGSTLKVYNHGTIVCNTNNSQASNSSVLLNKGTCYLYGPGKYLNSQPKHWYGIVNVGKLLEICDGRFEYSESCNSSMIVNGYAQPNNSGEFYTHIPGVNELHPTMVINGGIFNKDLLAIHGTIKNDVSGHTIINGGEFYSSGTKVSDRCIKSSGVSLIINGGSYNSEGISTIYLGENDSKVTGSSLFNYTCKLEVNGGEYLSNDRLVTLYSKVGDRVLIKSDEIKITSGVYRDSLTIIDDAKLLNLEFTQLLGTSDYIIEGRSVVIYRNKIKCNRAAIYNSSEGLVINGLIDIDSPTSAVTKSYVDDSISRVAIDESNLVHKGGAEIITGNKTYTSDIILPNNKVTEFSEYVRPDQVDYEVPSNLINITDDMIELSSGSYLLNKDRTEPLIITEGSIVTIYIVSDSGFINYNPSSNYKSFIHIKYNSKLYLYNKASIKNHGNAGGCHSNIINDGICYLYGGEYHNTGSSHWYSIVNRGEYLELNNCLVDYDVLSSSSIINNGIVINSIGGDESYISNLSSIKSTMVINDGIYGGAYCNTGSIKNESRGILTINNGLIKSRGGQCIQNEGKLVVNNGYIYRISSGRLIIDGYNNPESELIINNGYFETQENERYILICNTGSQYYKKPIINGGIFDYDNCIYVTESNSITDFSNPTNLLDYTGDGYYVDSSISNNLIKYIVSKVDLLNGIKLEGNDGSYNGIIANRNGLIIKGIRSVNDSTSVVSKGYLDNKLVGLDIITNEGKNLVSGLTELSDSATNTEIISALNKVIKLFRYIYLKEYI